MRKLVQSSWAAHGQLARGSKPQEPGSDVESSLLSSQPETMSLPLLSDFVASLQIADQSGMVVLLRGEWSRTGTRAPHPGFLRALLAQTLRPCDRILEVSVDTFLLMLPGVNCLSAGQTVQRLVSDLGLLAPELALPRTEVPFAISVLRGTCQPERLLEVVQEAAARMQLGPLALGGVVSEALGAKPAVPLVPGLKVELSGPVGPDATMPRTATITGVTAQGLQLELDRSQGMATGEYLATSRLPCGQIHWRVALRSVPDSSGQILLPWPERIDLVPRRRSIRHRLSWRIELGDAMGETVNLGEGGFLAIVPTAAAAGVEVRTGRLLPPEGPSISFLAQIVRNLPHRFVGKRLVNARFISLSPENQQLLSQLLNPGRS